MQKQQGKSTASEFYPSNIMVSRKKKNNNFAVKCKNRAVSLQIPPLFTTVADEFLMSALLCLSLSTWDFSLNPRNRERKKKRFIWSGSYSVPVDPHLES